ncbi:MAG: hypothetical protein KF729_15900 [Sandaracinaceae bacterium]|nr:hypothetical protein [Sandaracinaceae bacterium]
MLHRASLSFSWVLFSVALAGCGGAQGGEDGGARDAGGTLDAGAMDGGALDASAPADAAPQDAASSDAAPSDASSDAASSDAASSDAASSDAAASDGGVECDYLDFDVWITDCGAGYVYVRRFAPIDAPASACPEYYTLRGVRYDDLPAALAAGGCQPECLRRAATSVTLLRCGVRTGYIVFEDAEDDCEPVYETPDGLFPSVEAWNEAHPCP